MKIVITEDDRGIEDVLQLIFKRAGHDIQLVPDGLDVINNLYEPPDVFIIDKQLSGVSGLDVCSHLKQNITTRHIPVIMISASPSVAPMAEAAGADDFLEKPFSNKEILKLAEKYMKK